MSPSLKILNFCDGRFAKAKFFGNFSLTSNICPNFKDNFRVYLSSVHTFSFFTSAFFDHINHVFFVRRGKKMVWVYARSIIACMTDKNAFFSFTFKNLEANSMSVLQFPLISKQSIPSMAFAAGESNAIG